MNKNDKMQETTEKPIEVTFEEYTESWKFRQSENYLLREIAGESVLIPIGDGVQGNNRLFSLNSSCTYLWKAFKEPRTIREVVDEALEIYDAPEEELLRDIFSFVRDYELYGMIKREV